MRDNNKSSFIVKIIIFAKKDLLDIHSEMQYKSSSSADTYPGERVQEFSQVEAGERGLSTVNS